MTLIERLKRSGMIPRAVLYARYSSENQREESIEAQLRAMNDFCNRNGILVVGEYCDRAKSATTDDRPEFLRMIDDARKRDFDLVIVHKLDRFARNRHDSALYTRELAMNNIAIVSVLEQFDDSPESIILQSVLEGMNEYYSKNLSREVMKGLRENARECKYTGGQVLYGFAVDKETQKFIINETEAEIVRNVFQMVAFGYGYTEVLRYLKKVGAKTRRGNDFSKPTLYDMLRNEKYTGLYIFNRASSKQADGTRNNHKAKPIEEQIRIEGGAPQIVDPEIFKKVQYILDNRKRGTREGIKRTYALAGYVICGQCGHRCSGSVMQSGHNERKPVGIYSCNNRDNRVDACKNKSVHQAPLEALVRKIIAEVIFDESRIPEVLSAYQAFVQEESKSNGNTLQIMQENMKTIEQKIRNIVNVIANTGSAALADALQKLETEKRDLAQKIHEEEEKMSEDVIDAEEVIEAYRSARQMLINGTLEDQRLLFNQYLDRVVVYPDYVEIYVKNVPDKLIKRRIDYEEIAHGHTINSEQTEKTNPENYFGTGARTTEKTEKTEPDQWSDSAECGGAEGNRTPVRKQLGKNFSGRSLLFTFPRLHGNKHPYSLSSVMMHGALNALRTHVLYSDHTRARLVDLPGRMGA